MSNRRDEIKSKVIEIIEAKSSQMREITEETSIADNSKIDSLDIIEIVMEIEKEFKISLPDQEVEKLKTVGDTINLIMSKLHNPSE